MGTAQKKIVLSGNRRHPQRASHLNWKNDDKAIGIPGGIHFQASSDECEPKKHGFNKSNNVVNHALFFPEISGRNHFAIGRLLLGLPHV